MSRLAFRSKSPSPPTVSTSAPASSHHVVVEATLKPIGSSDYNKDRVAQQGAALKDLRTRGKDIFEINETKKVSSSGTVLYQTTETYGTALSVEKMIEIMQPNNLTLRVNFNRPGKHSSTTCMQLSSNTLSKLLKTTADDHGNKTAELRVKSERDASVPHHGAMFVAIAQKGTQHYLSHVDYKILGVYDALYHNE